MADVDPSQLQGMRAKGDVARSPELREARDKLVGEIDAWLGDLAQCRDSGQPTPNGTVISDQPLIIREPLAGTDDGSSHKVAETTSGYGASLVGDGVSTRFEFHAVRSDGDGVETTEVIGS